MSEVTNWITALSSMIAASGVGFVAYQAYLAQKTLKADHERSRRENAANLIMEWSINLKWEASLARKLVEKLSREETQKLYEQVPFSINKEHKNLVAGCLTEAEESDLVINNEKIDLTEKQSAHIGWLIISYLNLLESILVHWQHGIADNEMLKSEFQYLVNADSERFILHNFRTAKEGINNYPAIQAFVRMLKKEHEEKADARGDVA